MILPITGGRAAARRSGAFDGSPVVKIKTPAEGAVYRLGKVVHASYKCKSASTTIASCVGTVPKGAAIDTSTRGPHTFTVAATDADGRPQRRPRTTRSRADAARWGTNPPGLRRQPPKNKQALAWRGLLVRTFTSVC